MVILALRLIPFILLYVTLLQLQPHPLQRNCVWWSKPLFSDHSAMNLLAGGMLPLKWHFPSLANGQDWIRYTSTLFTSSIRLRLEYTADPCWLFFLIVFPQCWKTLVRGTSGVLFHNTDENRAVFVYVCSGYLGPFLALHDVNSAAEP